jgi:hypothetical protein
MSPANEPLPDTGEPRIDIEQRFALKESIYRLRCELDTGAPNEQDGWSLNLVRSSDVAAVLNEVDRLMLVNGQIAKMWCDSEDRAPPPAVPEETREPTLQDLSDRAGWLLREPLDFNSKGDQEEIREARSCVSAAHLRVVKSKRAVPSSVPSELPADAVAREAEKLLVSRFELNHLRNFVVLLDHYPKLKESAKDLQRWIEDKTSRSAPADSLPLESAPELKELLDGYRDSIQDLEQLGKGISDGAFAGYEARRDMLRQSIESLFSRATEERDTSERLAKAWQHETEIRDRQILALSAEASALRESALTPEEAAAILSVKCGFGPAGPVRPSDYDNGFSKLLALSRIRSGDTK